MLQHFENTQGRKFTLASNANIGVEVDEIEDGHSDSKKRAMVTITVDNDFQHVFNPNHAITKQLALMTPAELRKELMGGSYFAVDDKLVEFRPGGYDGFIHDPQSIQQLMDHIGASDLTAERSNVNRAMNRFGRKRSFAQTESDVGLFMPWSKDGIDVPGYREGGVFSSELFFKWSIFSPYVRGVFELVRLICSNGMVGSAEFYNGKVPLINRWQEHLDIANKQIQRAVHDKVSQRVTDMATERASVLDLSRISGYATDRLMSNVDTISDVEARMLHNISEMAQPLNHLAGVYTDDAITDSSMAAHLPGHLSAFDAWNMLTEILTHTRESQDATSNAVQKMANRYLTDPDPRLKTELLDYKPIQSGFSDPRTAFFGLLN
jgi:hypothetical protein